MSFHSSAVFYRDGTAPVVTAAHLQTFLRKFAALRLTEVVDLPFSLEVKWGRAIDQNTRPSSWFVTTSRSKYAMVKHMRTIRWDVEAEANNPADLAAAIEGVDRNVYRAHLYLGRMRDPVCDDLSFPHPTEEANSGFFPCDLGFSINPEAFSLLGSEVEGATWMSLDFSGYYYLYPWTPEQVVRRIEAHPAMRRIMKLLRSMWPVPSVVPEPKVQRYRKKLGANFPYPVDAPRDWFWGISESG